VGRKGTVVSFPHCEQFVLVSERIGEACPPPPPPPSARLALQALQRFGSFLKPLSAKNICSPAVKTNSALHSEHFSTRSWYSMSRSPLVPCRARVWAHFVPESLDAWGDQYPGTPGADPLGLRARSLNTFPNFPALRGPDSRKCGAEPRRIRIGGPDLIGTAPWT